MIGAEFEDIRKDIEKVANYAKKITIFFGNLAEYERYRGYSCEILGSNLEINPFIEIVAERLTKGSYETGLVNQESFRNLRDLCDKGVEAIVNAQREPASGISGMPQNWPGCGLFYGLPVKRKN